MNKSDLHSAVLDEFESLRDIAKQTRAGGNDEESRAESKYDTLATEMNYLADGLARQAQTARDNLDAYEKLSARTFAPGEPIDLGAAVRVKFPGETTWFFVGPAGGGHELPFEGETFTIITPDSPLGGQLIGKITGQSTDSPKAEILAVH